MRHIHTVLFFAALLFNALSAATPFEKAAKEFGTVSSEPSFAMNVEEIVISEKQADARHIWWTRYDFNFGREILQASFPTIPSIGESNGIVSIISHHKGVSYALSGFNPARFGIDAYSCFQRLMMEMNAYPYMLEEYEIEYFQENGISVFYAKFVNLHTGEKIRSKTVVTLWNAYTMEAVYKNHHDCDHERFFQSLNIHW